MIDRGVRKRTKVTFMALENKRKRREKKIGFKTKTTLIEEEQQGSPLLPSDIGNRREDNHEILVVFCTVRVSSPQFALFTMEKAKFRMQISV